MQSSDDEADIIYGNVVNYHFVDAKEEPICFSVLPFQRDGKIPDRNESVVFLRGETEDGLQKIYIKVTAWKLDLENLCPDVYVYTKDKSWVKLLKPRKSFESIIRKILVTVQCLHYIRKNPETSEKSLWDHVRNIFSHYEDKPSRYDLIDCEIFICQIIEKEEILAKSELLLKLFNKKPVMVTTYAEKTVNTMNSPFINAEEEEHCEAFPCTEADDQLNDDEGELFDTVCAICDNGGEILPCEGRCLRSFHAFKEESSMDSKCRTLGFTSKKEIDNIKRFSCLNCRWKKHQCFACGRLGSSDKSSGTEVFRCVCATCGHFYHPQCVAKLLHPDDDKEAAAEEQKITRGQMFVCPVHKCNVCKEGEDKNVAELQFAMCRRCPTSYHRKCLPREISFEPSGANSNSEEDDAKTEKVHFTRAWDDLLCNRILIYCLKHEIDTDLRTPIRNHLIFPKDPLSLENIEHLNKRKSKNLTGEKTRELFSRKFKKLKTSNIPKMPNLTCILQKPPVRSMHGSKPKGTLSSASVLDVHTSVAVIGRVTKERIMTLVQKSSSNLLTLDDFVKQKFVPSTHTYSARHIDKSITLGKVEGSIEAVKMALQKVGEDHGSIVNAKDVCEPGMVNQIIKWKNKLSIYLSPFIYGLRYTSYGRHFTNIDILKEIVDRLHWYVNSGDMIVDFCCGANDFSILMNKKLEATAKKCFYRNYDIIPPKNAFNFVKKDWMTVQPEDLMTGSRLIMGLNPPFGFKAGLANKFIDKALEFKPKLIILIVPKETQRLDVKRGTKYDLIWEDDKRLSGKAFYLPGTVDVNDKQFEQWNVQPPLLSLWSRHDWTASHKEIAINCGRNRPFAEVKTLDLPVLHNLTSVSNKCGHSKAKDDCALEVQSDYKALESDAKRKAALDDVSSKFENPGGPKRSSKYNSRENFDGKNVSVNDLGESSDMSISPCHSESENLSDHKLLQVFDAPKVPMPCGFGSISKRPQSTNFPSEKIDVSRNSTSISGREASLSSNLGTASHGIGEVEARAQGFRSDNVSDIHNQYALDRSSSEDIHSLIRMYGQHDGSDLLQSGTINDGANSGSIGGLSTMDTYARRLDDINRISLNPDPLKSKFARGRQTPHHDEMNSVGRNSAPAAVFCNAGDFYGTPGSLDGSTYDTTGFAIRWQGPSPHQGTSGWIDD